MPANLKASFVALALAAAAVIVRGDAAADAKAAEDALVAKLRLAPLATDRINILSSDDQFKFDFFHTPPAAVGAGGNIVLANAANFPAVIGTGSAMAAGFLEACSMNTPHMHPRATEIQVSVNSTIRTGMITENGARFILEELPPGSMTVFPLGSIHFQINDGCEPALFYSGFNSEDPGVLQAAQRLFGLPPDVVGATFGDLGIEDVAELASIIPDSISVGTDACLQRCGLKRPSQPTAQQQGRVSGNAFPSGVSARAAAPTKASEMSVYGMYGGAPGQATESSTKTSHGYGSQPAETSAAAYPPSRRNYGRKYTS